MEDGYEDDDQILTIDARMGDNPSVIQTTTTHHIKKKRGKNGIRKLADQVAVISVNDTEQVLAENRKTHHRKPNILCKKGNHHSTVKHNQIDQASSSNMKNDIQSQQQPDNSQDQPYSAAGLLKDELGLGDGKEYIKVDKGDPCSRLHFVKFVKVDANTRIRIWECGLCGKEFNHQYTLMRHLPTHTDERNFVCQECGKAFRQMSTLLQHKATHRQFKPFVCDICKKTFSRVSTLVSHKKRHNEEKPYNCHMCNKSFYQKGNLKNHEYTHTNERPYKCDICGKGFNQLSNLRCHKARTHVNKCERPLPANREVKCGRCEAVFPKRAQLRQHEAHAHGIKDTLCVKNSRLHKHSRPPLTNDRIGNIQIIKMTHQEQDEETELDSKQSVQTDIAKCEQGVLVDPVDTKEMHKAQSSGEMPLALLKPLQGPTVIVKVQLTSGLSHRIVSVCEAGLRQRASFDVHPKLQTSQTDVHVQIPIVATISQWLDEKGLPHMDVESPSEVECEPVEYDFDDIMSHSNPSTCPTWISSNILHGFDSHTNIYQQRITFSRLSSIKQESLEDSYSLKDEAEDDSLDPGISLSCILPADEPLVQVLEEEPDHVTTFATPTHLIDQSLQLTEQANGYPDFSESVQLLRPTGVFGEYEIISPPNLLNDNKTLVEESNTLMVDSCELTNLMDALQNVSYELPMTDATAQQIILDPNYITEDQTT